MKKIKLVTLAALALTGVSIAAQTVSAVDVETKTTTGKTEFTKDDTKVDPKTPDPDNPDTKFPPVDDPKDPVIPYEVEAGALAFTLIPRGFNFGKNKLSAADQALTTKIIPGIATNLDGVNAYYTKAESVAALAATPPSVKNYLQAVQVHDGRLQEEGISWKVTVKASVFTDATVPATPKTLAGSIIKIKNIDSNVRDTKAVKATDLKLTNIDSSKTLSIAADGTTSKDVFGTATGKQLRGETDVYWLPEDIELHVPGSEIKTGTYTSTITWTLTDGPMS